MYQLLDYKLACYLPFLSNMRPGVFHASSDTVEVFDVGSSLASSSYSFDKEGFTAVAHPNTLAIGRNHGVFVFSKRAGGEGDVEPVKLVELHSCLEVLQKPSEEMMRERGAIHRDVKSGEESVYTDSCYFYDHSISRKFIEFYKNEAPLDCELDSYGDFFQPLGPRATVDYVYNTSKVVNVVDSLIPTRKKIFKMLSGTPLHVLVLNASKFYHLGTTKEYLHHFCCNEVLKKEMRIAQEVFCATSTSTTNSASETGDSNGVEPKSKCKGIQLHSLIHSGSSIDSTSIVEYCNFKVPLDIGERCVVSNCAITENVEDNGGENVLKISSETFLHTVSVAKPEGHYCTILFSIHDNIKQRATTEADLGEMQYLGKPLATFQSALGLDSIKDLTDSQGDKSVTLWDTKLFPVFPDMGRCLLEAVRIVKCVKGGEGSVKDLKDVPRLSMDEVMRYKDLEGMLTYRHNLHTAIQEASK